MSKTALLLLGLAVATCKSESDTKPQSTTTLTDLTKSLDAVRTEFNAHMGEARFLTLLSPT